MKNSITRILILLFAVCTYSQQGINYKALLKDTNGNILASTFMNVEFSIHQSTSTGTIIYQEDYNYTTDANGLLILNIGADTSPSVGVFEDIDWSFDRHFLQTTINYIGGTINFDATEFMAVPYAKHAKTAGSATEVQTLANVVALGNSANGQLKNVTDPTDDQDAATKAYVDLLEAQIAALDSRITALEPQPAVIGELRAGGVVFWVDPADNTHGLVCAIANQSEGIQWGGSGILIGGTSAVIGTGATNTDIIITELGPGTAYAAGLARAYTEGEYNDWFLPSSAELAEMYNNRAAIDSTATANGGIVFTIGWYQSSTEWSSVASRLIHFGSGSISSGSKSTGYYLRAVRAF